MSEHAFLSASASEIWINCPAAPHASIGVEDKPTEYSKEGSFAHHLTETCLRLGLTSVADIPTTEFSYDTPELRDAIQHCIDYANRVKGGISGQVIEWIEERVDYSHIAPEGFGTADLVLYTPDEKRLVVIDWKFGKGVKVEAQENSQERLYAAGMVHKLHQDGYRVETIQTVILQPRLSSAPSVEVLTVDELYAWVNKIIPIARQAFDGTGEFNPGRHCRWCRVKAVCEARARKAEIDLREALGDADELPAVKTISLEWIGERLPKLKAVADWVADLEEYAYQQALAGETVPGYKLVEGRSVRVISDEETAIMRLKTAGYTLEQIYTAPELRSIGQLEKIVGKKALAELLDGCITKPKGKPVLVPVSDKRPAIGLTTADALGD